jgi:hypothetical protein
VKGRTVTETQPGDADPRAEREALDRLEAWHSRRPRRNVCRACGALHELRDVVCGAEACAAWRVRYEAALRGAVIRDGRLT